jgi:hypothetical protein
VLAERRGEKRLEDVLEWLITARREAPPLVRDLHQAFLVT